MDTSVRVSPIVGPTSGVSLAGGDTTTTRLTLEVTLRAEL